MRALLLACLSFFPSLAGAAHELGMNVHQDPGVGPNATKDAGLKWVRIDMDWSLAQPADGPPDWTVLDAAVNAARAKGLSVLGLIAYTPTWASTGSADAPHNNDVPVAGKYAAFVTLAVQHFKDRVTYFELWNEPNLSVFWEGSIQQYIDLVLKPGADAVRAACAGCKVLHAGLASLSSSKYDAWLDAMLKQASDKIDIVNGHIYAGFTEDDPNVGFTTDSFLNRLESHRILQAGGVVFYESPLSFKEVMDKNASTKPLWITETGLEAPLGDAAQLDKQTLFYRRVLEKAAARPWWTATIFYEAFDVPAGMYHFGIVEDLGGGSYTKKPVFDFLKGAVQAQAFGGLNPPCSDLLDNDGDGKIDFPNDPDCFDPNGASEGAPAAMDAGVLDAYGLDAAPGGNGDGGGSTVGTGGGGGDHLPAKGGCALTGADAALGPLALLLALLGAAAVRAARRRA